MAITLDELLGRKPEVNDEDVVFPTYEESVASRRPSDESYGRASYGYQSADYASSRREDRVGAPAFREDSYGAAGRQELYNGGRFGEVSRGRDVYSATAGTREADLRAGYRTGYTYEPRYAEPMPRGFSHSAPSNLYDFTLRDYDRLNDDQLYEKLAHTDAGKRPVFDRSAQPTVAARTASEIRPAERTAVAARTETRHGHLNLKGKLIVAAFLAVIVAVAVLIIVNASKLNSGKATTPSSSVSAVSAEIDAYIADAPQIQSMYEARNIG